MDPTRWMLMKVLVALMILVGVSQQASVVDMYKGDSVLLPCEFPSFDMTNPTVVWSRSDLSPSIVHQRQQDGDELKDQNQLYRGRTLMMTDALETGDLSLNLTALTLSDSGIYTCSVRSARGAKKVKDIQLQVKETFPSWAIALLVLLAVVLLLSGGLLFDFRQYFMSVAYVEVEPEMESVLLPCKTIFRLPAGVTVEWKCGSNIVHKYQGGYDRPEEQYCLYSGRTDLNRIRLRDLSLTLKFPADEDSATYTCKAYIEERNTLLEKKVELKVKVHQVKVEAGQQSVKLPFNTTPKLAQVTEVVWTRYEPVNMTVHTYSNNPDQPGVQDSFYSGRTEMQNNPITSGNFSLTLNGFTAKDTGRYVCAVWGKKGVQRVLLRNKTVELSV